MRNTKTNSSKTSAKASTQTKTAKNVKSAKNSGAKDCK